MLLLVVFLIRLILIKLLLLMNRRKILVAFFVTVACFRRPCWRLNFVRVKRLTSRRKKRFACRRRRGVKLTFGRIVVLRGYSLGSTTLVLLSTIRKWGIVFMTRRLIRLITRHKIGRRGQWGRVNDRTGVNVRFFLAWRYDQGL